jgi:hypothetical protein
MSTDTFKFQCFIVPASQFRQRMLPRISVPVLLSLHAHLYFERGVQLLPLLPLPIPYPSLIPRLVDFLCTTVNNYFLAQGGGRLKLFPGP